MSNLIEWLNMEKSSCDHKVASIDATHNKTLTLTVGSGACPKCLRNEIHVYREILSRALALGINMAEDEEDDHLRDELLDDIDKMMAPVPA